jgi:hypothetical protein
VAAVKYILSLVLVVFHSVWIGTSSFGATCTVFTDRFCLLLQSESPLPMPGRNEASSRHDIFLRYLLQIATTVLQYYISRSWKKCPDCMHHSIKKSTHTHCTPQSILLQCAAAFPTFCFAKRSIHARRFTTFPFGRCRCRCRWESVNVLQGTDWKSGIEQVVTDPTHNVETKGGSSSSRARHDRGGRCRGCCISAARIRPARGIGDAFQTRTGIR